MSDPFKWLKMHFREGFKKVKFPIKGGGVKPVLKKIRIKRWGILSCFSTL